MREGAAVFCELGGLQVDEKIIIGKRYNQMHGPQHVLVLVY